MDISSLSNYYSSIANQQSASANHISNMSEEEIKAKSDEELMDACKEFEAYFLEQIFKGMEKTVDVFKAEESSGANGQLVDYFKESTIAELAGESTDQNSLGLAQMLYEQMKRNYNI